MEILKKLQQWADSKAPVIKAAVGLGAVGLAIGAAIAGQWLTVPLALGVASHALTSSSQTEVKK